MGIYKEHLDEANRLASLGDHKAAIECYKNCCETDWWCIEALHGLAGSYTWLGEFRKALQVYIRISACYPKNQFDFFVLKTRIRTYLFHNDDPDLLAYSIKAVKVINRVVKEKSSSSDFLAELFLLKGDKKQAHSLKYSATIENACKKKNVTAEVFSKQWGQLPNFFIIGPQKTATTALYSFLLRSPDVYPLINKELFFFGSRNYNAGIDWYKCHFPKGAEGYFFRSGEATATYFNDMIVPKQIREHCPQAKLIFTLRDPAKRAISSFYMEKRHGRETGKLYDAISSEIDYLRKNPFKSGHHPAGYYRKFQYGYVYYGLYKLFVDNFREHFPEKQIMILHSEDLHDPQKKTNEVCDFLDVTYPDLVDVKKEVNEGRYPKDKEYDRTISILNEFYSEYEEDVIRQ